MYRTKNSLKIKILYQPITFFPLRSKVRLVTVASSSGIIGNRFYSSSNRLDCPPWTLSEFTWNRTTETILITGIFQQSLDAVINIFITKIENLSSFLISCLKCGYTFKMSHHKVNKMWQALKFTRTCKKHNNQIMTWVTSV